MAPTDEAEEIVDRLPSEEPLGPVLQAQAPQESKSGLLRSGAIVMLFAAAANGLNVVFHFSVARFLKPDEYALLTTIFAVNVIATVPLIAVQTTVARELSLLLARGDTAAAGTVLRTTMSVVLRFAAVVVAVMAVLAAPAVVVLNIDRPLPILATALSIVTAVPLPATWGALQASERFSALSLIQSVGPTLKLVFGVALAAAGFGASAITFGVVVANVLSFALGFRVLRSLLTAGPPKVRLPASTVVGRYAGAAALALAGYTALTQADVIWARGALTPGGAGDYAAASTMANFVLLLPVGVTTVLFPRIARMGRGTEGRRHLVIGLGAVGGLSVFLLVAFAVIPSLLLRGAFGPDYLGAKDLLVPLGLAMLGYAFVTVYINHFLAQGRSGFIWILAAGFVLQQVLFYDHHASGRDIVWVQVAVAGFVTVLSEIFDRSGKPTSLEIAVAPERTAEVTETETTRAAIAATSAPDPRQIHVAAYTASGGSSALLTLGSGWSLRAEKHETSCAVAWPTTASLADVVHRLDPLAAGAEVLVGRHGGPTEHVQWRALRSRPHAFEDVEFARFDFERLAFTWSRADRQLPPQPLATHELAVGAAVFHPLLMRELIAPTAVGEIAENLAALLEHADAALKADPYSGVALGRLPDGARPARGAEAWNDGSLRLGSELTAAGGSAIEHRLHVENQQLCDVHVLFFAHGAGDRSPLSYGDAAAWQDRLLLPGSSVPHERRSGARATHVRVAGTDADRGGELDLTVLVQSRNARGAGAARLQSGWHIVHRIGGTAAGTPA